MSTIKQGDINRQAKEAALAAMSAIAVQPTGLVKYESAGTVVVIGDALAQQAAGMLPEGDHTGTR